MEHILIRSDENIEKHKDSYKEINEKPDFADGDLMHHLPPGAFPPFEEVIKRNEERAKEKNKKG